jgi:hypothetical protein
MTVVVVRNVYMVSEESARLIAIQALRQRVPIPLLLDPQSSAGIGFFSTNFA